MFVMKGRLVMGTEMNVFDRAIDRAQLQSLLSASCNSQNMYDNALNSLRTSLPMLDESSPYVKAYKNGISRMISDGSYDDAYSAVIKSILCTMNEVEI